MRDGVIGSTRLAPLEIAIYTLLSAGVIVLLASGSSNGVGYFQQPQGHDLLWPLVNAALFNGLTFFANAFWLVPLYLRPRRWGAYLAGLGGLLVCSVGVKTLGEELIIALAVPDLADVPFWALALENLYIFPAFLAFSFAYRFGRDWTTDERERQILIEARQSAEMALLRAQIGPHFLFNTLNNLYSLGLQGRTEEVTQGIARLSGLLRFILHDSGRERIPLSAELTYIESFLELTRLMVPGEDLDLQVDWDGVNETIWVAPMMLFPFVENAVKHGVGTDGGSFIRIALELDGGSLAFSVANSIPARKADLDTRMTGLGLDNVRRRLALAYPDAHELTVDRSDREFRIRLRLAVEAA